MSKASEKCLVCGDAERSRGLCSKHYQAFVRAMRKVPEENREAFENELISEGMLQPRRSSTGAEVNPFETIAAKYKKKSIDEEAAEDWAIMKKDIDQAMSDQGKEKKPTQAKKKGKKSG